jgi:preprotein translocase subunit SecE
VTAKDAHEEFKRSSIRSSILKKIIEFIKESRMELKKVNWPSKDEVLTSTRVVVISILIIAAVIALMDYVIKTAIFWIIGG